MRFARQHKINSGLLFVLPALSAYLIYVAWPVVTMFNASLLDWDGVSATREYVGLRNYVDLLTQDTVFRSSFLNNVQWAVITLPTFIGGGFAVAYLLSDAHRFTSLYRAIVFLPTTASFVVSGYVWLYIFEPDRGPLNTMLRSLGADGLTKVWLGDQTTALYAVIVVAIWSSIGFFVVISLAAIQSIPRELFEAAEIDGAGGIQKMALIAFPLTIETTRSLIILALISAVNQFGLVFVLTRGGPFHASETMAYQIYAESFLLNHTGYAAALSAVLLVIAGSLTLFQLRGIRQRDRINRMRKRL